jgi:hypothetical protein
MKGIGIISKYCKLNDKEKALFKLTKRWCNYRKCFYTEYVFSEPWRYVLKIKPHFISHYKMHDNVLEQQMAELDNHIEKHHLQTQNHETNQRKKKSSSLLE